MMISAIKRTAQILATRQSDSDAKTFFSSHFRYVAVLISFARRRNLHLFRVSYFLNEREKKTDLSNEA